MGNVSVANRKYKGTLVGEEVRRTIGPRNGDISGTRIFRVRRYGIYKMQDRYQYFVPPNIPTVLGEPYRRQWIAAVHKWRFDLTTEQKEEYSKVAKKGRRMSGFNLFMREAMKGLLQMYVDRGDPAAYDKAKEDLTIDGAWHDWDVSAIVPAGAKAILLIGHLEGNAIDWKINFRKKGNVNEINHCDMETIRANVTRHRSSIVSVDANRVLEYNADNQTWTELNLCVRGWWT